MTREPRDFYICAHEGDLVYLTLYLNGEFHRSYNVSSVPISERVLWGETWKQEGALPATTRYPFQNPEVKT